jgi:hypothetical protein
VVLKFGEFIQVLVFFEFAMKNKLPNYFFWFFDFESLASLFNFFPFFFPEFCNFKKTSQVSFPIFVVSRV